MNFRFGLVLAGALAVTTGACAASSGGGSTTGPAPSPAAVGAELLRQGERPRENEHTRAADNHMELAEQAATPDAARPHYMAAVQSTEQAIAADARNPRPWLQAGIAYIGLGDYQKADSMLDEAETLRPIYQLETEGIRERAWIDLYNQAIPFINGQDYQGAVPFFENANAIYDQRPEVMVTLGQVYATLGDADKAVANLQRARVLIASEKTMEMDSVTQAAWREQGEEIPLIIAQAYMQAKRYDDAANILSEIVAADPDNRAVARTLASVYIETDQPDAARGIYRDLLNRPGLTPSDYYQVGIGFYQMEDYRAAADAFKTAAGMSPKDREALEFWARSLQYLHQDQEAGGQALPPASLQELASAAEQWGALDPNNQNSYIILAQTVNKLPGNEARVRDLIAKIENLPVWVEGLDIRREPDGGATVRGEVRNKKMQAGQSVTLQFTFYDRAGSAIGTQNATVRLPAVDATQVFDVQLQSDREVFGYSYTVS